jgi:hypothetical protein
MKAVKRTMCLALAIGLGGLLASSTAWATLTEVSSATGDRSVLNVTTDTVVWPLAGSSLVTSVLNGASFLSDNAFEVSVFRAGVGPVFDSLSCEDGNAAGCDFQVREQPATWTGNFLNGEHALENLTTTPLDDSIQIEFSEPVLGAGAQLQLVASGPFVGRVRVYSTPFSDGSAGLLGEFSLDGVSCNSNAISDPPCLQGSAIFMGFSDTVAEIKRIEFNVLASGAEAQFGINQLDIGVRTTVVPEPGTFLLLTVGGLALAYGRRRFSR